MIFAKNYKMIQEVNFSLMKNLLLQMQILLVLAFLVPGASAFDGGDAAALILGLGIGIFGVCTCLGYYARKRGGV